MSKLIRGVFLGVLEVASAGRLQYVVVVVAATAVIHVGEGRRVVLCHHAGQARLAHAICISDIELYDPGLRLVNGPAAGGLVRARLARLGGGLSGLFG